MPETELFRPMLAELESALAAIDPAQIDRLQAALLAADRVFVAGKGRTGLRMRAFAMRLMHLGLCVHAVDDVTTPAIRSGDLLLVGSASGRTRSLMGYVEVVGKAGAALAAITGNLDSPIADAAETLVHIPATNFKAGRGSADESAFVMGSLYEHCLGMVCDLLIARLKTALDVAEAEMNARHANLE